MIKKMLLLFCLYSGFIFSQNESNFNTNSTQLNRIESQKIVEFEDYTLQGKKRNEWVQETTQNIVLK